MADETGLEKRRSRVPAILAHMKETADRQS